MPVVEVRVDSGALRDFVVRVRDSAGVTLGTGVLVAPGRVLTCAHVVKERQGLTVQSPTATGGAEPGGRIPVRVLLRSSALARAGGVVAVS